MNMGALVFPRLGLMDRAGRRLAGEAFWYYFVFGTHSLFRDLFFPQGGRDGRVWVAAWRALLWDHA